MSEIIPKGTRKPPATAWRPGVSGNPSGRPAGARNKTTLAAEAILRGEAEGVAKEAVRLALEGDTAMIRVVLDKVVPTPKDKPIRLELPPLATAADCPRATSAILEAVAEGTLTPSEGAAVAGLVESHRKSLESEELELRVQALERAQK